MKNFGFRLKTAISSSRYTQKALADELHITEDTITNYIKGKSLPKADILLSFCNKLSVSADWLLGNAETNCDNNKIQNLSDAETLIIEKYRSGAEIVFEEDTKRLTGDAGRLNDIELDIILKFRMLDNRDQEDIVDNINSKYRRSFTPEKSSISRAGKESMNGKKGSSATA